jgi:hypothetical protein
MRTLFLIVLPILVALLLSACGITVRPSSGATASTTAYTPIADIAATTAPTIQATTDSAPTALIVPTERPSITAPPTLTNTPVPTNTPIPPTNTPMPTDTPVPPTRAPQPTRTPVPATVVLPTQVASSPPDPCLLAEITSPVADQVLDSTQIEVLWDPPGCQMYVQYYQDGKLIYDTKDHEGYVGSPYKLSIATPGRTQIKIWAQAARSVETNAVWVTIDPCLSAKITSPGVDQVLGTKQVDILWDPPGCQMYVQYYQDGKLIYDTKDHEGYVGSPYKLSIATPGRTQIKIWAQAARSIETNAVWVTVKNDAK